MVPVRITQRAIDHATTYRGKLVVAIATVLLIVTILNVFSTLPAPLGSKAAFVIVACGLFQILLLNLIGMARERLSAAGCGMRIADGRTASASLTFVLFTYGISAPAAGGLFLSTRAYMGRGNDLSLNLQPPAMGLLLISVSGIFFARLLSSNLSPDSKLWLRDKLLTLTLPFVVLTALAEVVFRGNWYLWLVSVITVTGTLFGILRICWELEASAVRLSNHSK